MPLIDSDDMLISVDAAKYLGVTKQRIYALRDEGVIGQEVAGIWLYSKTELDHYRATRKGKRGRPKGYSPKKKQQEIQEES